MAYSTPSPQAITRRKTTTSIRNARKRLELPRNVTPALEPDWLYVTIRRSGRKLLDVPTQMTEHSHTVVLDSTTNDPNHVRDLIWDEFEFMKSEIEIRRASLASPNYIKGELKTTAPIPWLVWATSSGKQGQTRKKENFFQIWEDNVESCLLKTPPARYQVTSILLPKDTSSMFSHDDSLTVTFDCDGDSAQRDSAKCRPRCDSGVAFETE